MTPVQAVKLDILLRQYLCDGLADHISESEKVSAEEADSLQKDIHEGDTVHVTFDENRVALFSPEGREI